MRRRPAAGGPKQRGGDLQPGGAPVPDDRRKLLTVRDVSVFARCSPDLVYRAIASGELSAMRIGRGRKRGRFLIRQAALDAWLKVREDETARELRAKR